MQALIKLISIAGVLFIAGFYVGNTMGYKDTYAEAVRLGLGKYTNDNNFVWLKDGKEIEPIKTQTGASMGAGGFH